MPIYLQTLEEIRQSDPQRFEGLFRIAGWPVPEFTEWPLEDPSEPLSDEALLEVPRPAWTRLYRDETLP